MMHPEGSLPPTELLPFGESIPCCILLIFRVPASEDSKVKSTLDSSNTVSEYEFGNSLGEFTMGAYSDISNPAPGLDSYYNSVVLIGDYHF